MEGDVLHACHVGVRGREPGCRDDGAGGVGGRGGSSDPRNCRAHRFGAARARAGRRPASLRNGGRTSRRRRVSAARPWQGRWCCFGGAPVGSATYGSCRTCSLTSPSPEPATVQSAPALCCGVPEGSAQATADARRGPRGSRTGDGSRRPGWRRSVARSAGKLGVTWKGLAKLMARLRIDRFSLGHDRSAPAPSWRLISQALRRDAGNTRAATAPTDFASNV